MAQPLILQIDLEAVMEEGEEIPGRGPRIALGKHRHQRSAVLFPDLFIDASTNDDERD